MVYVGTPSLCTMSVTFLLMSVSGDMNDCSITPTLYRLNIGIKPPRWSASG